MIRPPPRSPLFPSPPLSRSRHVERIAHRLEIVERLAHPHHDDVGDEAVALRRQARPARTLGAGPVAQSVARHHDLARSEEHTSELQSPCKLLCRPLLAKKKQ